MRKTVRTLLITVCLLLFGIPVSLAAKTPQPFDLQTAFSGGALALRETKFLQADILYTVRIPADWENAAAIVEDSSMQPEYSEDGAWITYAVDGASLALAPGYASPDGGKMICLASDAAWLVEGNAVTLIIPNAERSVEDTYGSFARFLQMTPQSWVDTEGVAWSPDGRYAALTNYKSLLVMMRMIYGLYVVDTQTGELLCLSTYPSQLGDGAASVMQACFDETGRYLYYLLYSGFSKIDGDVASMYRYDMETGDRQKLCGADAIFGYPKLQLDSQGRLWNLITTADSTEMSGLNLFAPQGETWSITQFPLPQPNSVLYPSYMELGANDTGVFLTMIDRGKPANTQLPILFRVTETGAEYLGVVRISSFDSTSAQLLAMDAFTGQDMVAQMYQDDALVCLNAKLSPGGRYALMMMKDRREFGYLLLDTETLALCRVQAPGGRASPFAALGATMNRVYPAGYNWISENQLAVATQDGLKLFELYVP